MFVRQDDVKASRDRLEAGPRDSDELAGGSIWV